MKAYFIGGSQEQTIRIVEDNPPRHMKFIRPTYPVPPFPYGKGMKDTPQPEMVIADWYQLVELIMPTGEDIAVYLYDPSI